MDRGAWPATPHAVAESAMTERLIHTGRVINVFCYVNETTLGKHLGWGLVASRVKHLIRGLEFSVPSMNSGDRRELESITHGQ